MSDRFRGAALVALVVAVPLACGRTSEPALMRLAPSPQGAVRYRTRIDSTVTGLLGLESKTTVSILWSAHASPGGSPEETRLSITVHDVAVRASRRVLRGGPSKDTTEGTDVPAAALRRDASFGLRMSATGRLLGTEGLSEMLDLPAAGRPDSGATPPSLLGAVARTLAERVLGEALGVAVQGLGFVPLPEEPVVPGARWSHTTAIHLSPFGEIACDNQIELLAVEDGAATGPFRVRQDMLISDEILVPAGPSAQPASLEIERGYLFGQVRLDPWAMPLDADVECGLTLSLRLPRASDAEDASEPLAITAKWHLVTIRVAGE